jgi:long-chain acyl-CoA synthetase
MKPWIHFLDILKHVETYYDNSTHLNYFQNDRWHSYSTKEVLDEIRYLTLGLISLGIKRGDCVGLISLPSPRWMMINFAVAMAGAILVPIFPDISEENFVYEIKQTHLKTLFIWEYEKLSHFEDHRDFFVNVISLNGVCSGKNILSYVGLLEKGKALELEQPQLYSELQSLINADDLVAIIYTSGTTGVPKGVEHTHLSLSRHTYDKPVEITPVKTRYLNVLPLAHIFGYTINLILFGWGGSIYYWNDPKQLATVCQQIHPTLLVFVPRILEKIYAKVLSNIQQAGFMKRQLGQWAFDLANNEHESFYKTLMHPIADRILYHKLRENLGGSIELIVSGGAALDAHLNHFYNDIGVPICQGWGLTEACPICFNRLDNNKVGTAGPPLGELQVKISPQEEILVKGTAVMRGYYHWPEETAKTIDQEGWLHTGDRGALDDQGFLIIKGRLKEMFKTSTGEYVAPVPIEQALCKAPLIEAALVVADGKKFVSCLLFTNKEVLESLKTIHSQENRTDEEFLNTAFVREEMNALINNVNKHLNEWEKIQVYRLISHSPSIEGGELTPTMKLKRDVIMKNYKSLIDSMYQEVAKV